jgi:tetratricopeptide (TPR) repeat protein
VNTNISKTTMMLDELAGNVQLSFLYHKGEVQEALTELENISETKRSFEQKCWLGKMYADLGRWDDACALLEKLEVDTTKYDHLNRMVSNILLQAGVYLTEQQQWAHGVRCFNRAREVDSRNPALEHLPQDLEISMPIIFHLAGDYDKALEWHVKSTKFENISTEKLHMLAISSLSALLSTESRTIDERIAILVDTHCYWIALSFARSYWDGRKIARKDIYGDSITGEDFLQLAPQYGISRCEALLDKVEDELQSEIRSTIHHNFQNARTLMAIEKQSANLVDKICTAKNLNLTRGGCQFLLKIWQGNDFEKKIQTLMDSSPGSDGWLLKGLLSRNSTTQHGYLLYATGAFAECADMVVDQTNFELLSLSTRAAIRYAENMFQVGRYSEWHHLADKLKTISDTQLRSEGLEILKKMILKYFEVLRKQNRIDELLDVAERVLADFKLPEIGEQFGVVLIKKAKECCSGGDMEGCLENFKKAFLHLKDLSIYEVQFAEVVGIILNDCVQGKNFTKVFDFLNKIHPECRKLPKVTAQEHMTKAIDALNRKGNNHPEVFNNFKAAYEADTTNREIAMMYSMVLSQKSISVLNDLGTGATKYRIENTIRESENLLLKAIEIDPNNKQALENLKQLFQMISNAPGCGVSLSPKSLGLILGINLNF